MRLEVKAEELTISKTRRIGDREHKNDSAGQCLHSIFYNSITNLDVSKVGQIAKLGTPRSSSLSAWYLSRSFSILECAGREQLPPTKVLLSIDLSGLQH